eukprot:c19301_g2_i1.p2 GENE.c19301_g2_i1~~c19301_g2_i1.p2  ORF type:complete len:159 (+),score=24.50 c19301_g2_i1:669-1145(+)
MYSADRAGTNNQLSDGLRACLPYIKFLDTALVQLGEQFQHRGPCYRGVKWVYPNLQNHDPVRHFPRGKEFFWYEFKSSSRDLCLMDHERFCGNSGPRTIFVINSLTGYKIDEFSKFGQSEKEVLFRPLTEFKVVSANRLCHPNGGNPDVVELDQVIRQ